jgi:hypothetical protein
VPQFAALHLSCLESGTVPNDAKTRIEELAATFVAELKVIARDQLADLLGDGRSPSPPSRTPQRSPRRTAARSGGKRSQDALESLQQRLVAYVKDHAGERVEQINAGLGTTTKDLALPIRKLVASGVLATQGIRRATRYSLAGKRKAGGKATRKKRR